MQKERTQQQENIFIKTISRPSGRHLTGLCCSSHGKKAAKKRCSQSSNAGVAASTAVLRTNARTIHVVLIMCLLFD